MVEIERNFTLAFLILKGKVIISVVFLLYHFSHICFSFWSKTKKNKNKKTFPKLASRKIQ